MRRLFNFCSWVILVHLFSIRHGFALPEIATCSLPASPRLQANCGRKFCCVGFHCVDEICVAGPVNTASEYALKAHSLVMSADASMNKIASDISLAAVSLVEWERRSLLKSASRDSMKRDGSEVSNIQNIQEEYQREMDILVQEAIHSVSRMHAELLSLASEKQRSLESKLRQKQEKLLRSRNITQQSVVDDKYFGLSNYARHFIDSFQDLVDAKGDAFRQELNENMKRFSHEVQETTKFLSSVSLFERCSPNVHACRAAAIDQVKTRSQSALQDIEVKLGSASEHVQVGLRVLTSKIEALHGVDEGDSTYEYKLDDYSSKTNTATRIHGDGSSDIVFALALILSLVIGSCVFRWIFIHFSRRHYDRIS